MPADFEIHQLEQIAGAIAADRRVEAVDLGDERQRLRRRQAIEQREILRHDADAALDRHRIGERIDPEDAHRARGRPQQPGQALDRRRLAGAVRTEKAVEAAGRHGEIDAVDGAQRTEVAREPVRLDREFHGVGLYPGRACFLLLRSVVLHIRSERV